MEKKVRVLEVFGEPISNGGQESFVINIVQHINHEHLVIDMLTPYYCDNSYYEDIVKSFGGTIYTFGLSFEPGKSRFNINDKIDAFFKEHPYDVVHIHSGSISILCIMAHFAKKNHVKKIIVHSHCAAEHKTLKYRLTRMASYPYIMSAPTDYCACSVVAGEWKYPKAIVDHKLKVLKNGVDLEKFAFNEETKCEIRKKLAIPEDAFVLGHVGRFSYQKNHEYLIRIFAEVRKRNEHAVLMLIGDGENKPDVKKQIEELHLTDSVRFCGLVNNVNDYMQAMDVFVLPSRYEGLPIVGVEAQAAGLPVITSVNVPEELEISDLVTFLELKEDVSEWADKILSYEGKEREDASEQIRSHGYDVQFTADEIEKMYLS